MNEPWSASEDEGDVRSQTDSSSVSKSETSSSDDVGTRYYTTLDRNGEEHGWEWWNLPKCRKEGLTQTKDEYQLLHMVNNLQRVELPWTQIALSRVLEDHQVDISKFGKKGGSTVEKLAAELQAGEVILVKSSGGLLRVVNVVLVQVVAPDKKVLLEEAMTLGDGHTRTTNRLPGTRQTAEESEYDAALRILKTKLRFPDKTYELDIGTMKYTYVKADDSFPGLQSLKRICHIRCDIDRDNVPMLTRLGLLGSAYECAPRGVKTDVAKYHFKWGEASDVKFGVHLPIPRGTILYPWNEQSVSDLLKRFKIDVSKFGSGGAKRLDSLAQELSEGGSHLMSWDGRLVRVVNMVILNLNFGNYHLVETSITTNSGVKRPCKRWPGKIQPESEDTLSCIQDILESKLQIPIEQVVKLSLARETRKLFSHEMSASYPGLPSLYCKQMIQANLSNLDAAMRAKVGLIGVENASSATSWRTATPATRSAASSR
jgi:hypothetical protein